MPTYRPHYSGSHALVIGIDAYPWGPLAHARADAEAVAEALRSGHGFRRENVHELLDGAATRAGILDAYLGLAGNALDPDARLVVYFAGHGHTEEGNRGPVGYLVPADGDPDRLATLLRWDDLVRNAELIRAKHILFVMDACYGGLAVARGRSAGSRRFLEDMLSRLARQVVAGGKGDQPVADGGGPRAGHSLFTGHLLDALEGRAADGDGVITATSLMAYVYERVRNDPHSRQTPHFGSVDGDGDLILKGPATGRDIFAPPPEAEGAPNLLLQATAVTAALSEEPEEAGTADRLKSLLADPADRIRLDDAVNAVLRESLAELHPSRFPADRVHDPKAEFAERIERYERAMDPLLQAVALLGRWATPPQRAYLRKVMAQLASLNPPESGLSVWIGLRWYPSLLAMYCGGVAAIQADDYDNLACLLLTEVSVGGPDLDVVPAVVPVVEGTLDVNREGAFKLLPGHERHLVPASERLFRRLQPILDDLLFLGAGYEPAFDRFEMLYALAYADLTSDPGGRWGRSPWAPPGRFAWKERAASGSAPLAALIVEAKRMGAGWPPLKAGFFRGSPERFAEVAAAFSQLVAKLPRF